MNSVSEDAAETSENQARNANGRNSANRIIESRTSQTIRKQDKSKAIRRDEVRIIVEILSEAKPGFKALRLRYQTKNFYQRLPLQRKQYK